MGFSLGERYTRQSAGCSLALIMCYNRVGNIYIHTQSQYMDIELIENYFGFNDLKPSLFYVLVLCQETFSLFVTLVCFRSCLMQSFILITL